MGQLRKLVFVGNEQILHPSLSLYKTKTKFFGRLINRIYFVGFEVLIVNLCVSHDFEVLRVCGLVKVSLKLFLKTAYLKPDIGRHIKVA